MKALKSLEDYKRIIKDNKERLGKRDTNCFLHDSTLQSYVDDDRLFYRDYDDGTAVFADDGDYYNLYYFWGKDRPFAEFTADKTILVSEMNNNGRRDDYIASMEKKFFDAGFSYFKSNLLLEHDTEEAENYDRNSLKSEIEEMGLRFVTDIDETLQSKIVELWLESLDPTDVPIDHQNFIERDDDRVICILDKEDCVASAYWYRIEGKNAEGRHIVTAPAHYQKGLASLLLRMCLADLAASGVEKLTTYVSDTNEKSLRFHYKIGFVNTNKVNIQYALNCKEEYND